MAKISASSMLRDSGVTFALRLTAAVVAYLNFVLQARLLDPAALGHFVFAQSSLWLLVDLATLGLGFAAMRFIPGALAQGRLAEASNYVAYSQRTVISGGVLLALIVSAALWATSGATTTTRNALLLIICLGLPFGALTALNNSISRGFNWFVFASTTGVALRPILFCGALVVLLALSRESVSAIDITWILVFGVATVAVLQALLLGRRLRKRALPKAEGPIPAYWLRTGIILLIAGVYSNYALDLHIVIGGLFMSPEDLAVFNAVLRTLAIIGFASAAVGIAVSPRAAAIHARGDLQSLNRLAQTSVLLTGLTALIAILALIVLGKPILSLFGAEFVVGYPALLIAAAGQLFLSISVTMLPLVAMTGHHVGLAWGVALLLPIIILVHALCVPAFGILGASCAFVIAAVFWSGWVYCLARQRVGLRLFLRRVPVPDLPN